MVSKSIAMTESTHCNTQVFGTLLAPNWLNAVRFEKTFLFEGVYNGVFPYAERMYDSPQRGLAFQSLQYNLFYANKS
jgi:hypothetical protein